MRRFGVVVGAIVVVGLVGAGLAVASGRGGIVRPQVLRFAAGFGGEDTVDVGPAGDSVGDTFLGRNQLQNFALTEELGHEASACVLEELHPRLNHCTMTVFLPLGTIELSTRFNFTDTRPGFRLAVIGGTGRFENVVGQAVYAFGCDACPPGTEDVDTLTLRLIPSFHEA